MNNTIVDVINIMRMTDTTPDHTPTADSEPANDTAPEWVNNRVLVVDDEPKILDIYLTILSVDQNRIDPLEAILGSAAKQPEQPHLSHFEVDTANSGQRAVTMAQNAFNNGTPYAVIFMDVRMPPGINGVESAEQIRSIDSDVYIVFSTAFSDYSADEMQIRLSKNMLMMSKPFDHEALKQTTRTLCMNWSREHHLSSAYQRLHAYSKLMEHQANHDGLTGVYNRHYLNTVLNIEINRAHRDQQPIGLLMIDIDWFKRYNDQYGHLTGDYALKTIAQFLTTTVQRPADFVTRFGGEEFCAVLPNTEHQGVESIAEKIRAGVEALQIEFPESGSVPWITASVGGICCIPSDSDTLEALLSRADQQLYDAKKSGKNCCLIRSC